MSLNCKWNVKTQELSDQQIWTKLLLNYTITELFATSRLMLLSFLLYVKQTISLSVEAVVVMCWCKSCVCSLNSLVCFCRQLLGERASVLHGGYDLHHQAIVQKTWGVRLHWLFGNQGDRDSNIHSYCNIFLRCTIAQACGGKRRWMTCTCLCWVSLLSLVAASSQVHPLLTPGRWKQTLYLPLLAKNGSDQEAHVCSCWINLCLTEME